MWFLYRRSFYVEPSVGSFPFKKASVSLPRDTRVSWKERQRVSEHLLPVLAYFITESNRNEPEYLTLQNLYKYHSTF